MEKRYIMRLNGKYEIYDQKTRKVKGEFVDCRPAINLMVKLNNKAEKND